MHYLPYIAVIAGIIMIWLPIVVFLIYEFLRKPEPWEDAYQELEETRVREDIQRRYEERSDG